MSGLVWLRSLYREDADSLFAPISSYNEYGEPPIDYMQSDLLSYYRMGNGDILVVEETPDGRVTGKAMVVGVVDGSDPSALIAQDAVTDVDTINADIPRLFAELAEWAAEGADRLIAPEKSLPPTPGMH